jgi:cell division protein FtsQ
MSKTPPHDDEHSIGEKFPGLTSQKPVKSISVQRPLDSDQKTVIERNLDDDTESQLGPQPIESNTSSSKLKTPKSDATAQHRDTSPVDDTVLELPPSPAHRKARRRKILTITLITTVVVLTGGWALLYFSPILAIEDISHEGLDLVAESAAEERTAVLLGTPLPQVNDSTVTEIFADTPAVEDVTLRAEPPHGLVVIVNEYTPVAMSPQGKQYVVFSEAGSELAEVPAKRAQEFDLPVVASASDVADQDVFDTITEVLGSLPDDLRDQVWAASGTSIDSIQLELSSGKTVMWGNNEQAEKKIGVLEALLGLDEDQAAEISEYDVSAPDFPVTR